MTLLSRQDVFCAIVSAPFGAVGVRTEGGLVRELVYLPASFGERAPANPLAAETVRQIGRYVADPDWCFDLPLAPAGSLFQRRVWEAIAAIPRGDVVTYGMLARRIGSAPRAVGQACGANWFPLVIPCHRVVAAGGLGGFSNDGDIAGFHVGVKRWLLGHEGAPLGAPGTHG